MKRIPLIGVLVMVCFAYGCIPTHKGNSEPFLAESPLHELKTVQEFYTFFDEPVIFFLFDPVCPPCHEYLELLTEVAEEAPVYIINLKEAGKDLRLAIFIEFGENGILNVPKVLYSMGNYLGEYISQSPSKQQILKGLELFRQMVVGFAIRETGDYM